MLDIDSCINGIIDTTMCISRVVDIVYLCACVPDVGQTQNGKGKDERSYLTPMGPPPAIGCLLSTSDAADE